jgi:hypothetical protein
MLDEDPAAKPLLHALPPVRAKGEEISLIAGPEGGWTDRERRSAGKRVDTRVARPNDLEDRNCRNRSARRDQRRLAGRRMILALLLLAGIPDWVPAHWTSNDPKSLELLEGSGVNCVLVAAGSVSESFLKSAAYGTLSSLA